MDGGALSARGAEICSLVGHTFGKKQNLDNFWQELAEQFYPERADFTETRTLGEDFASRLYSSEPLLARRDFGNYIGAALRPKGRVWFKPRARRDEIDEIPEVQKYLENRGLSFFNRLKDWRSRFVQTAVAADHDYVTFGNSVTSFEERADRSGLKFRTWHLRDCAWLTDYDGEVNTLFRKAKPEARNVVANEKSKGWSIHPKVREKIAKNPTDSLPIYHCLMPADFYDPSRKWQHPFVSVYIDIDNKWVMSEKAVPVFNYNVSRWFTIDSSPYAFSPAALCALPDSRTLQSMTWSIVEAGEKAVEPPMVAVEEVVQGGVDLRAGAVTWIDKRYDERTGDAIRTIDLGGNPQFGEVLREGIKGNLKDAWYLSRLFLPQEGPQMTAQEVQRRHEEWLRVAQPIIEPAEPERNGMLLDGAMALEMHIGLWGRKEDMPKALSAAEVDFAYDNPLEDARKVAATNSFRAVVETVGMGAQVFGPELAANIDSNKAFRQAIIGVAPPDWLKDEGQVKEEVDAAKQAAMVNEAAQQAAGLAQVDSEVQLKQAQAQAA